MCVCKGTLPKKGYLHSEWFCEPSPKRLVRGIDYCGKKRSCVREVDHEGECMSFMETMVAQLATFHLEFDEDD